MDHASFDPLPHGGEPSFEKPIARLAASVQGAERRYFSACNEETTLQEYLARTDNLVSLAEQRLVEAAHSAYRERLERFAQRTVGSEGRVYEDIVSEAFIRIHRHIGGFDLTKKFSTWAYTITRNLCRNEFRNRNRSPLVLFETLTRNRDDDDRPLEWEDNSNKPDDLFRKRYMRALVEDTVAQLDTHHRTVFDLRELQGKSYEEISEILDLNVGTTKSRLHRARAAFAKIIGPRLGYGLHA